MHLEQITIIGYVGKDPSSNQVNGKSVCNFSVGVSKPKATKTNWYRVAAWGAIGEACQKILSKGKPVLVQGSFDIKDWEYQGTPDKIYEIQASTVQFLFQQDTNRAPAQAQSNAGYGNGMYSNDEVPF